MSLILEALKKSEAERQRGKAPGLFVEQAVAPVRGRQRTPGWAYALGVLLVVVVGVLVWREWSRADTTAVGAPPPQPSPASGEGSPDVAALPPLPPAGEGRGEGAPGASVVAPPVALPPPQPSPAREAASPDIARVPAPVPAPAPRPVPAQTPTQAPTITELPEPTNTLPRLTDLPASERNALPPLKITMHVYADEPSQRFVILDGRRHGEGANPADGVVIQEIRRDGLVLSLRGRDVLLPRP